MNNLNEILSYTNNFKKYEQIKSVLITGDKEFIKNPHITIAIPTYKRPKLLKEAIDSALNQINYNYEYEVIIVDNEELTNKETETEKIIKTYSDKRLFYYKNEKNIGMFGNINRCIELSHGKWVALLHDDDLLKTDYLSKITSLLNRKKNIGVITANYRRIIKTNSDFERNEIVNNKNIKQYLKNCTKKKLMRIRAIDCEILNDDIYGAPTCGVLFNKDYFIKEGGFNEKYFPSADWFFMYKFNKKYKTYKPVDILSYYRILDNESLKINTIKNFVIDKSHFIAYTHAHSLIGLIMHKIFKYEQHVFIIDWAIKLDMSSTIKPEEFNYICEYKIRPVRLFIYKKIYILYWKLKYRLALIFG